jgi:hypothetical protein
MLRSGLFALECVFSGVFLWLGLYLITRDQATRNDDSVAWWRRPATAMGIAMLCEATVLAGVAMSVISDDPKRVVFWVRLTHWFEPFAVPAVLWAVIRIVTSDATALVARRRAGIVTALLLMLAGCFAVLQTATNFIYRFDTVVRLAQSPHYLVVSPAYPGNALLGIYYVGTLLAAAVLLFRHYVAAHDEVRYQLRWLAAGMVLLVAGAIVLVSAEASVLAVPPELGDALLVCGIFSVGYGVARHSALLQHRVITQDFYRSLTGATIASGLFLFAFIGLHALSSTPLTPMSIPLLIWFAILTITLIPWFSSQLDRVFLPPATARARQAFADASAQLSVTEEEYLPEALTGMRRELELRELATTIERDVEGLFYRTNYTREGGGDYISLNTGLLHLAAVEEAATTLMLEEGVSPAVDRQYYQLKAFRQLIDTLIAAMLEDAVATTQDDATDSDRRKRLLARATILQQQFIQDVPRATVQRTIVRKYGVGDGGGYGRLLTAAKKDLAHRLYLAERRAREAQRAA